VARLCIASIVTANVLSFSHSMLCTA
jgi:hypothetical protein